jgi:ketosteroid isomerase-like protein
MSQEENVEIARRGFEHFTRTGEFDPELIHPDAEFDNSNAILDADVYKGHEGLRKFLALLQDMWEQFRFEPQEFIPVGDDQVLVTMRMVTEGRDGIETSANSAGLFTHRDGKVIRIKSFQSKADPLEDVGLEE